MIVLFFLQLFKFVCVGSTDELSIHVEDLSLWVHQELSVVSLNLDSPHDHIVLHVDTHLLLSIALLLLLVDSWLVVAVVIVSLTSVFNVHSILSGSISSGMSSVCPPVLVIKVLKRVLVSAAPHHIVFGVGTVLDFHWIICLVVQESFPFEEVLSSLESALLLHLLEA